MSEPSAAARTEPVLSYATKDADGLPDWVAEAETLINQGRRPRAMRKLFRNAEQTVKYYAKSSRRRYGRDALSGTCAGCSAEPAPFVLQVTWSATCPPRFLEFRLSEKEVAATFETLHALCPPCLRDWVQRLTRFARVRSWLGWGMGILTVVFITLLVLRHVPVLRGYVPGGVENWSIGLYIGGLVGLSCASSILNGLWRLRHPRVLRRLMPRDVTLVAASGVFTRDEDNVLHSVGE